MQASKVFRFIRTGESLGCVGLRAEQHGRHHGDAIPATVGVASRVDDHELAIDDPVDVALELRPLRPSIGGGPAIMPEGSDETSARCAGSSRRSVVVTRRSAVAVFPTPFGPSRTTAGNCWSSSSSSASTVLRLYSWGGAVMSTEIPVSSSYSGTRYLNRLRKVTKSVTLG